MRQFHEPKFSAPVCSGKGFQWQIMHLRWHWPGDWAWLREQHSCWRESHAWRQAARASACTHRHTHAPLSLILHIHMHCLLKISSCFITYFFLSNCSPEKVSLLSASVYWIYCPQPLTGYFALKSILLNDCKKILWPVYTEIINWFPGFIILLS